MRAIRCENWGKAEDLRWAEVPPPPAPAPHQVKIAVMAAGVNFADTLIIAGRYQVKPELPFTPGFELAGLVLEVGAKVSHVKPGDRVMALVDHGAFAGAALDPGPRQCILQLGKPRRIGDRCKSHAEFFRKLCQCRHVGVGRQRLDPIAVARATQQIHRAVADGTGVGETEFRVVP